MGILTSTVATLHRNDVHGDDNYLVRPLGERACLDAVMDGVTGRRGGEASRVVKEALAAASLTSPDDVVAVLKAVNQTLYRRGGGRWWLTTVSAALFLDGILSVVGVGDSPVFLIRSDADQPLFSHVSGFAPSGIARALGVEPTLRNLYRAEVSIELGDRLILATDGVTASLTRRELVGVIRGASSPEAAAEQITTLLGSQCGADRRSVLSGKGFRGDDWTAIVRFFGPADVMTVPGPWRP